MCDPLSAASALLTIGGSYMQSQSQRRAERGIQNAITNNANMQDKLLANSQAGVLDAANKFDRTKFDQTQADETGKIQKSFRDNLSQGDLPGEYYGGKQSENTQKYSKGKSAATTDYSREIADALARMRGFEQGMTTNNTGINRAGERVLMNNNFMQGNNAVLPLEIEAAKRKGQNSLADLMVGLGHTGLSAGLSNVPGAGGVLNSQSGLSRWLSGTKVGPINGFGGTGFNLI